MPKENAAQIIYGPQQGSLTIVTDRSSLAKVLAEIHAQLGIRFDGGVEDDRVSGKFGPGGARDVIESLLRETGYNFILVGDGTRDSLTSVVIAGKRQTADAAANGSQEGTGIASGGGEAGTSTKTPADPASGGVGAGTPTEPAAADAALQNAQPATVLVPSSDGSPYTGGNPNSSTVQQSHAQVNSLMRQQSQQLGAGSPPPK